MDLFPKANIWAICRSSGPANIIKAAFNLSLPVTPVKQSELDRGNYTGPRAFVWSDRLTPPALPDWPGYPLVFWQGDDKPGQFVQRIVDGCKADRAARLEAITRWKADYPELGWSVSEQGYAVYAWVRQDVDEYPIRHYESETPDLLMHLSEVQEGLDWLRDRYPALVFTPGHVTSAPDPTGRRLMPWAVFTAREIGGVLHAHQKTRLRFTWPIGDETVRELDRLHAEAEQTVRTGFVCIACQRASWHAGYTAYMQTWCEDCARSIVDAAPDPNRRIFQW